MKTLVRNVLLLLSLASGLANLSTAGATSVAGSVENSCSWNHPGANPFMGDVVSAVDRYQDIPADVRGRLKARMAKRDYDEIVSIQRDSIAGRADYGSDITDMHFGTNQVCKTITRKAWSPQMQERGLVYCESGECILVPTVCRNVSRIKRTGVGAGPAFQGPAGPAVADETMPLDLPPTGAGAPPTDTAAVPPAVETLAGGPTAVGGSEVGPIVPGPFFPGGPVPGPNIIVTPTPVPAVPEPHTWALMIGGLLALLYARRFKR